MHAPIHIAFAFESDRMRHEHQLRPRCERSAFSLRRAVRRIAALHGLGAAAPEPKVHTSYP